MPKESIQATVLKQLDSFFLLDEQERIDIASYLDAAIDACECSFSRVRNKYYSRDGEPYFDVLHGCQYTMLLYQLSRKIYGGGALPSICDKLYALLKIISSADLFYQVELPSIFTFDHPLGAVMGRADYADYFAFSQGCTVGNNKGTYPHFGKNVFMMSNSKIIGNCRIGDYVIVTANAYVKDTDIPDGSLVFGQSPTLVIKDDRLDFVRAHAERVFKYE